MTEIRNQKSEVRKSSASGGDPFRFSFWLRWILWFAGSFVASALFWTLLLDRTAGPVRGEEKTLTWAACVFGSWFLIVIPFMRKKERIWKRLNQDQEKAVDAWLSAMGLFIGFLVASALFWTWKYEAAVNAPGLDGRWARNVFGTWLLAVMPLLAFMYRKADMIFKEATARQLRSGPRFRTAFIEREKRLLPRPLQDFLLRVEPTLREGHLVTACLRDGRKVPHVFVLNASEVIGLYDQESMNFDAADIVGVEPMEASLLPAYEENRWLRLDGRA